LAGCFGTLPPLQVSGRKASACGHHPAAFPYLWITFTTARLCCDCSSARCRLAPHLFLSPRESFLDLMSGELWLLPNPCSAYLGPCPCLRRSLLVSYFVQIQPTLQAPQGSTFHGARLSGLHWRHLACLNQVSTEHRVPIMNVAISAVCPLLLRRATGKRTLPEVAKG
jgi:hypothetical protein